MLRGLKPVGLGSRFFILFFEWGIMGFGGFFLILHFEMLCREGEKDLRAGRRSDSR